MSEFVNAGVRAAQHGVRQNDMPGDLNVMISEASIGSDDSYIVQQRIHHHPYSTMPPMAAAFPHWYNGIPRDALS